MDLRTRDAPFSETWARARRLLAPLMAQAQREELHRLDRELLRLSTFRNEMFHNLWLPRPTQERGGARAEPDEEGTLFRVLYRYRAGRREAKTTRTPGDVLAAAQQCMDALKLFWELATPIIVAYANDAADAGGEDPARDEG